MTPPLDRRAARLVESRFLRAVTGLWTAEGIALGLGLVQAIVLARSLGPTEFGTFALVIAVPTVAFALVDARSEDAMVKYLGEFQAGEQTRRSAAVVSLAYRVDAIVGITGVALLAVAAPWVKHHVVKVPVATDLLAVSAFAAAAAITSATSRGVLASHGRFAAIALVRSTSVAARVLALCLIAVAGGGLRALVVAVAVASTVEAAWLGLAAQRAAASSGAPPWWRISTRELGSRRREILRFMGYTNLSTLVATFAKDTDILILGYATGPADVGYYRLARSLAVPIASAILPLQAVVYPRLSALVATNDVTRLRQTVRRLLTLVGLPLAGLTLFGVVLAGPAVRLIASARFDPATTPARWLIAGSAFVLLCFWVRPLLLALGRVRYLFVQSTVTAAMALVSMLVLTDRYGASGTAAARAVVTGIVGTGLAAAYALSRLRRLPSITVDDEDRGDERAALDAVRSWSRAESAPDTP
jgi:O-antigen/teichoic acid export membrane protein